MNYSDMPVPVCDNGKAYFATCLVQKISIYIQKIFKIEEIEFYSPSIVRNLPASSLLKFSLTYNNIIHILNRIAFVLDFINSSYYIH